MFIIVTVQLAETKCKKRKIQADQITGDHIHASRTSPPCKLPLPLPRPQPHPPHCGEEAVKLLDEVRVPVIVTFRRMRNLASALDHPIP